MQQSQEEFLAASKAFFDWFKSQGGIIDTETIGLHIFEDSGRGAIALRDIEKGEVLFDIPRDLVLSTRTCTLQSELTTQEWTSLGKGWTTLILCMMWEESKGTEGKWAGYFASMPTHFTTLMFWDASDLSELQGSTVVEKIGKEEVEANYHEKLLPLLKKRSDIFPKQYLDSYYSLTSYHIQGSRILSRSFHVEKWQENQEEDVHQDQVETEAEADGQDAMEVELNHQEMEEGKDEESEDEDEDEEDEDAEDTADVGMTPMADLLNARYGCNNARLFYEDKKYLRMIATKPIKKGDQIWNTYGDPPNSDLVRRYGHTDYIETPQGLGNPADVVELSADIITGIIKPPMEKERVDLFLEEGGDDVFAFDAAFDLPDDFLVFIRLLSLNESEWKKAQEKNKLPKPKKDLATLQVAEKAVVKRMEVYPTSLEDDEKINLEGLSFNKRNAVIVRMGEKRILRGVLYNIQQEISRLNIAKGSEKRKRNSDKGTESRKKNKRQ